MGWQLIAGTIRSNANFGMEMNGSQVPVRSVPMQVPELILNSSEVPLEEPEVGEALPCFEDKMWPLN